MRLGATQDGKLVSFQNDIFQHTSLVDDYVEDCTQVSSLLYSSPHSTAIQHFAHLNVGTPTPMRGPGRTPALLLLNRPSMNGD